MPSPRVQFLVGGVQKGGTTALARCLSLHPDVALPANKEAHVFDAPDFDERWDAQTIDCRYAPHFQATSPQALHGDATPIYCMHPRLISRIARYNPAMKWIVLLRHPVERAISHYHMERQRGDESWRLLPAMLCERWRLRGHEDDWAPASPLRHHGYLYRGDYARQLDALLSHFDRQQVLLLRSDAFLQHPREQLQRVYQHLGLAAPVRIPESTKVFAGTYPRYPTHGITYRVIHRLLRAPMRELSRRYLIDFD